MTKTEIPDTSRNGKTILLYTGNIMMDGGRGGFLNTSMLKNNAEVCHSSPDNSLLGIAREFVEAY